jgi:sterol 3beta-glucosyltransferase
MKITILTFGSRGDVEPYLALAQGLQQSGHRVTMAAPAPYADWIRAYGVLAFPLPIDIVAFLQRPDISGSEKPWGVVRHFLKLKAGLSDLNTRALNCFIDACSGTDFILQTGDAHGGVEIADRLGIPMAFAFPFPYAPTRDFPTFFSTNQLSFGRAYNHWSHRGSLGFGWQIYGPPLNRWRAKHFGLPPLRTCIDMLESRRHVDAPTLYAFSSSVVQRPSDWRPSDHITGYWFLEPPAEWRPNADLAEFLASGPPPIYVGFGSMPHRTPERNTRNVLRALELSGQRGVLMVGGGGAITRMPASRDVFFLNSAPHGWLFPQMAAVVHHGGAGTTAAVLRSGVPGILSPISYDQFTWAHYVKKIGVGLRAPQLQRMSAERLAKLIDEATGDRALRARAEALGRRIRAENGVANAVEVIERYAGTFRDARQRGAAANESLAQSGEHSAAALAQPPDG